MQKLSRMEDIVNQFINFFVKRKNDGIVNQEAATTSTHARHVNQFDANKLDISKRINSIFSAYFKNILILLR